MLDDEFKVVSRQLEETLSELNKVNDPGLRRSILSNMRRLLVEADRLAAESARPRRQTRPNNEKQ